MTATGWQWRPRGFIPNCLILFRRLLADDRPKLLLGRSSPTWRCRSIAVPDFIPVAGQLDVVSRSRDA
jgi:hypothetical protein